MNAERRGQGRHPLRVRARAARLALLLLLAAPSLAARAPGPGAARGAAPAAPSATNPPAGGAPGAVATVGGIAISRTELEQRTAQALGEYHARAGTEVPSELRPVVKRQMLERIIQRDLLVLEARRRGITVSDAEAEQALHDDPFFKEGGVFNEAKFQTLKNGSPAQFRAALEQVKVALAARRLTERASAAGMPDERELRARATHGLERASFDFLALRRREFDGGYPEPREAEILDYYRQHAADFQRPARAVLSVLVVQQELGDSITGDPARLAAWERGQRARADSVLRVAQGGVALEQITKGVGVLKTRVVALPGNFPSYWHGDDAVARRVFELSPGQMLSTVVPSNPGWLVVRCDQIEPAHTARLGEAAGEIRLRLRADRKRGNEERTLRAIYLARRDSLRGPALRARVALLDTAAIDPGTASTADLDRAYRAHLADYSTYDATRGEIVTRPLADVRDELEAQWRVERRAELARAHAEQILDLWSQGRRDPRLEAGARVREIGLVPLGAPVDTGATGEALTAALAARGSAAGADLVRVPSGIAVCQLLEVVPSYTPTFEQAVPRLQTELASQTNAEEERGARQLFDRDPRQFAAGKQIHWTSLQVNVPDFMTMTMTHREVEEYRRRHLERYSAPEVVHASHILVSPQDKSPQADARAHARADSLLARLRAGQDFARLAREYSDDEATRDQGGDLGEFGRGVMLQEFERAAFALQPGEMSGLVHTEVGYHIIRCHAHLPTLVQPLALMYSNVSADLAQEKADSVAGRRADSLQRVVRTPAAARAAARTLGIPLTPYDAAVGESAGGDPQLEAFLRGLEKLKPGEFYPGTYYQKGTGYQISWVDSITAARAPAWETARSAAIARYRREAPQRALEAKRAELDSLLRAGWSLDSLGTLFGGLEHAEDARLATSLPFLGARNLDTLVFGTQVPAQLRIGEVSDWVTFPAGVARLRVIERAVPNPGQLAARLETERRLAAARGLETYFEGLKRRYPVRILDAPLREVELPRVPDEPAP